MEFFSWKNILITLIVLAFLTSSGALALQYKNYFFKKAPAVSENQISVQPEVKIPLPPPPPQKLSNPPAIIKAVYATGYSAGSKKYLDYLTNLFKNTEINAVVVDVKGSSGYVSYASGAGDVKKYNLDYDIISDIDSLVRFFHNQNIPL